MALGLDGAERTVKFDMPVNGVTQVRGDYLAMAGLHVDAYHWVETSGYTLSITFRTQTESKKVLGSIVRQPEVTATTDTDPKVLSEVRQELIETMEG